jgi:SAM-dependent methyltransferase
MKLFALFFVLISPLFSLEHALTFSECQKQLTQVFFAEAIQNTTPSSILLLGNIDPTLPSFLQQRFPSCQISTTIQPAPVDCVILLNLLEKDPYPEQIVRQMYQSLKPGGVGIVVVAPLGLTPVVMPFFLIPYRHDAGDERTSTLKTMMGAALIAGTLGYLAEVTILFAVNLRIRVVS